MLDNLKTLTSMAGQAKELRDKFEQLQTELGRRTVEADSGAGAVRVVVNGKLEIKSVKLDLPMLKTLATTCGANGDDEDRQMVEDLIAAAVNAALTKAKQMMQQEASRLTGGLNIPGLEKMLGGS